MIAVLTVLLCTLYFGLCVFAQATQRDQSMAGQEGRRRWLRWQRVLR